MFNSKIFSRITPNAKNFAYAASAMAVVGGTYFQVNLNTPAQCLEEREKWPVYTRDEIRKHNSPENRMWVSWKESVYDVTDFFRQGHPGGPVAIKSAAGGPLEPFWGFYKLHRHPNVQAVIAKYKVGHLHPDDIIEVDPSEEGDDDVVQPDLDRHPDLYKWSVQDFPFNAMTPPDIIAKYFITPYHAGYIRAHNRIPVIDESKHKIDFFVGDKFHKALTMKELKSLPTHEVMYCMRCAGHRRSEMSCWNPRIVGVNYGPFAISNVVFKGARITDVLKHLGIREEDVKDKHFVCSGADEDFIGDPVKVSVPVSHALDHRNECMLAYAANGKPFPEDHGFPVRFLTPGYVGIRNCKWLCKVELLDKESNGRFQQRAYKVFKELEWKDVDQNKYPPPMGHCLNSVICFPLSE